MTILLVDISITLNIVGLALVSALEAWRPGSISGAVNFGLIWIGAVIFLGLGLLLKRGYQKNEV